MLVYLNSRLFPGGGYGFNFDGIFFGDKFI